MSVRCMIVKTNVDNDGGRVSERERLFASGGSAPHQSSCARSLNFEIGSPLLIQVPPIKPPIPFSLLGRIAVAA
jgi:hypothetical protein